MKGWSCIGILVGVAMLCIIGSAGAAEVTFKVAGQEPEAGLSQSCRSLIVGPWKNQPEEYQGYNGFVGWPGVTRLRSGRMLVTFTSGTWHATPPWTDEVRKDPEAVKCFEEWHEIGLPDIDAPRGGRCHIMHSDDDGLTWSKPAFLVDTEDDDRHPTILELDDGTWLCTFFKYRFPRIALAMYMRSTDQGKTWSEPKSLLEDGSAHSFGNGSAIQLVDGSLVLVAGGTYEAAPDNSAIGVLRSTDRGETFQLASVVQAPRALHEPTVAQLPSGRLVMILRKEGDICWSDDGGVTWEQSGSTEWGIFDPHVLVMPNGVLACFHGSYKKGGIRVLLSPDGGKTWNGPGEGYGYSVERSTYGYCHPMLLPDGTVYVVYLHTGGHRPADARTQALWGLRVRIHDDAGGIDILPAPGSAAQAEEEDDDGDGGDPVLGDEM